MERSTVRWARARRVHGGVKVVAWQFLADLGIKKPSFLPDFGKDMRVALLKRFWGPIDESAYRELLADDATIYVETKDEPPRNYSKDDWIKLMCGVVAPAIPDFNWSPTTEGSKDDDGYCIVEVQATGHHTGTAFAVEGLPPVPATGKRFLLQEEVVKVKVERGQVTEVRVLPVSGAGIFALYQALGGELPAKSK